MSPHVHGSGGAVDRPGDRRRLTFVLGLTFVYMLAEAAGGWWTGSLALLADAGHMLTDVASLGLALAALWFARRPATTRHTFAFARVEILAALLNGLALWAIVVWIALEAVGRFRSPEAVHAGPMMVVAAGGLVVNAIAFAALHRPSGDGERSLNLRGALLHVLGDLLGSVGALTAGALIAWKGWEAADPVASLVIGVLILVSSWRLVREAVHILLEGAPRDLDMGRLIEALLELEGVTGVHDLHVWTITSGYPSLSAHVTCGHDSEPRMLLARVNRVLRDEYDIHHTTIQIERGSPPQHDTPMVRPVETVE